MTDVFDCDGVILRSNRPKSDAFHETALPYGWDAAGAMVKFHRAAGSMTRLARWEHFFRDILHREPHDGELERVLAESTCRIQKAVAESELMPGVEEYLALCTGPVCVSGVLTAELATLLHGHGIAGRFAGIYGGPRRKRAVLQALARSGVVELPSTYYGDTEDDYQSAVAAGLGFVFVRGDTEWEDWQGFFASRPEVRVVEDFRELVREAQPVAAADPVVPVRVRVAGDGFATVRGARRYLGRSLAGAEVTVR